MSARIWLRLAELAIVAALVAVIIIAWYADRRDRAQLATQLASAQQTIAAATSRQKDRDSALSQTLAELASQKQSAVTPAQILNALPQALSLPVPLALQAENRGISPNPARQSSNTNVGPRQSANANVGARFSASPPDAAPANPPQERNTQPPVPTASASLPNNPAPKSPGPGDAVIPSADLKPLYDFALDCKACQAKLAAAQSDLADEKTKSAALAKQRDDAVRAVKGGSALRRIARAAKWFALGAAAGALAAKAR